MYRRIISCFLVILFIVQMGSALSTTLKSSYQKTETIIARVDGSLLNTLSYSQIEFKSGTASTPLQYGVEKINSNYYIWAISPSNAGNYTLYIHDVATSTQQQPHIYSQNFSVGNDTADYNVNPGAILTNGDFSVVVTSNLDSNTQITTDFPSQRTITLNSGANTIDYATSGVSAGIYTLNIGTYAIPMLLANGVNNTNSSNNVNGSSQINVTNTTSNVSAGNLTNGSSQINVTNTTSNVTQERGILSVSPNTINNVALINSSPVYYFFIRNDGNVTLQNISMLYNSSLIKLDFDNNTVIKQNGSYQINISFVQSLNRTVKTNISIFYSGGNIILPMFIDLGANSTAILDSYIITDKNQTASSVKKSNHYCSEISNGTDSGRICTATSLCAGTNVTSIDGKCCVGRCVVPPASSSSAWIGWLIAGIVAAGIGYVYVKYKKVKPETNPLLPEDNSIKPERRPLFKENIKTDLKTDEKTGFKEDFKLDKTDSGP